MESQPSAGDRLHRFVFEHSQVRGELVHLDTAWRDIQERGRYPEHVRELLGEASAAAALLAATIEFEGSLILQASGSGPLSLLVAEATGARTLRALAHWEGELPACSPAELLGEGRLAITIDPGGRRDRYQGIVELQPGGVADTVQAYFDRSEQLPTRLWLAVDEHRAAGLLLQNLPGSDGSAEPGEDWNRLSLLAGTIERRELLGLPPIALLRRLFHEEDVRVFQPQPVRFSCRCSRQRVEKVLRALGPEEMRETLAEQGSVTVDCEFCNARYEFDAVDVESVFARDEHAAPGSHAMH